ncbi:PrsW family glutamic-type intramembrane protease [Streptomyces sp. NPDC089424]|uniref:PrsW family glutamic-type intramembrane protease n=1 Tax=Streptomyces sp. NPDC089424 TaxID=3365917 RepID=UPI00382EFFF8
MTQFPPPGAPRARIPSPQQPPPSYPRIRPGLWRRCLWSGLALWASTALAVQVSGSTALLPTLVLLGSFLVPVTFVLWACERHGRDLGVNVILGCFLTGGTLGILGAALTKDLLLYPSPRMFAVLGLAEEAMKLGALLFVLRRQTRIRGLRAGLVLGAAVGLGFAAMEGVGYAFHAAAGTPGLDLGELLETEILRGVPASVGQGLWTAIAGGVLLACRHPNGRFRLTGTVAATYLGVALLHTLAESTHGIAVWLVVRLTGGEPGRRLFTEGYIAHPTEAQQHLFALLSVGGLIVVALLGLAWASTLTRRDPSWRSTP